jgi:hypothetical protein
MGNKVPNFGDDDVIKDVDEVNRRAGVVQQWLENFLDSDLHTTREKEFVAETRQRIRTYGLNTTFTQNQFYWLKGIYERATGDESGENY